MTKMGIHNIRSISMLTPPILSYVYLHCIPRSHYGNGSRDCRYWDTFVQEGHCDSPALVVLRLSQYGWNSTLISLSLLCYRLISLEKYYHSKNGRNTTSFYPQNVRVCLQYLLTSLVDHRCWLEENLPKTHPLFVSRVLKFGTLMRLKSKVQLGFTRNKRSGLVAYEIPPSIAYRRWKNA